MTSLNDLLNRLDGDSWRSSHPFSDDMTLAAGLLHNPYTRDDERKKAIKGWLAANQPCIFGRAAAKADQLFISIIDEKLIAQGDEVVKARLKVDRQTWKQWSLGEKGRHGFLLAVVSPKLHHAAPNNALRAFAERVRELFAEERKPDAVGNDMAYEWLYLKNPATAAFHKFRVILDFFAAAGDGRWWHDHRFPAGIAFAFNSLGHMARTQEWYKSNVTPTEWAAKLAMTTIATAFPHPNHGPATWLLALGDGKGIKPAACPFRNPQAIPDKLKGKDWTTYAGYHHTDHSIRAEFFDGCEDPDRSRGPYLMDFAYIGGGGDGENKELMDGIVVESAFLDADLGSVEEWRFAQPVPKPPPKDPEGEEKPIATDTGKQAWRPPEQDEKIKAALEQCNAWLQTPLEV